MKYLWLLLPLLASCDAKLKVPATATGCGFCMDIMVEVDDNTTCHYVPKQEKHVLEACFDQNDTFIDPTDYEVIND